MSLRSAGRETECPSNRSAFASLEVLSLVSSSSRRPILPSHFQPAATRLRRSGLLLLVVVGLLFLFLEGGSGGRVLGLLLLRVEVGVWLRRMLLFRRTPFPGGSRQALRRCQLRR